MREKFNEILGKSANKIIFIVIGLIFLAFMYFGFCFFKFQEINFNAETMNNNNVLLILTISILFLSILSVWNIFDRKSFEKKILFLITSMKNDIANSEDNLVKVSRTLEEEILEIYDKLNNKGVVIDEKDTRFSKVNKLDKS